MSIKDNTLVFKLTESDVMVDIRDNNNINNFIADLRGVDLSVIAGIKDKFITFGRSIYDNNGSFVIIYDSIFDDNLTIVPTLEEAYDYIEIEEIERKLNL